MLICSSHSFFKKYMYTHITDGSLSQRADEESEVPAAGVWVVEGGGGT